MTTVLLTTVMSPFGVESDDCTARTQPELYHGQITFAQGIFSIRSIYGGFGLEYIAANIKPKTVVLNYPTEKSFIKELQKNYDYVGITYVMATHRKMEKMVALIRQYAPKSKVILGGYGTTIPGDDKLADYICREDGIIFMRRLLGENIDAPRIHPIITTSKQIMGMPMDQGGIILAGLGCPNGCDFCCTSHFFNRKHMELLPTGKDIWDVLERIDHKIHNKSAGIMEEDFLLYKKRVMELAEYTRRPENNKHPVRLAGFASLRSIKMYDPTFLVELGIESLWVGVESKSSVDLRKKHENKVENIKGMDTDISTYSKMDDVDIEKTIKSLQDVGINTLISMIVGLEHHTEELLKSDLEFHISLKPTLSQFMMYTPIPGTPLFECLNKEGRILNQPWHLVDGYHPNFKHKYLTSEQLLNLQQYCYDHEYAELGPSLLRFVEKNFTGYLRFRDSSVPIQRIRAENYSVYCKASRPLFDLAIAKAPSDKTANWMIDLKNRIENEFGKPKITDKIMSRLAFLMGNHLQHLVDKDHWTIQPKPIRITYTHNA